MIACWFRMSVSLHLYSKWYTLLPTMLLRCEFSADAVNLDGDFCLHLRTWIPDKLHTVQAMRIDLHINQAAAQWDVYAHHSCIILTRNILLALK